MTQQSSLENYGVVEPDDNSETPGGNAEESSANGSMASRLQRALQFAPEDAEPYADDSCPWCLGTEFRESQASRINDPACVNCGARIPVDADWYQRGEKIAFTRHDL